MPRFSRQLAMLTLLAACFSTANNLLLPLPRNNEVESLSKPDDAEVAVCSITNIKILNLVCSDNGTLTNYMDDFYTLDVRVKFNDKPSTGFLILTGSHTDSIPISLTMDDSSHNFTNLTVAVGTVPIDLNYTATFSALPACTFTKDFDLGLIQCTTCPGDGASGQDYPDCWPPEGTNPPDCDNSLLYAPDPTNPETTPIKYVRAVVHIFQKESGDPENFTEAQMGLIKSWFDGPNGMNHFLGNLCPSPDDYSPDISDSRIRIINTGTKDFDVFFHKNNFGWGTGYYDVYSCPCGDCCSQCNNCAGCCSSCGSYHTLGLETMEIQYVTGGNSGTSWHSSLTTEQKLALSDPEIRNAYHVFISAGKWRDCNNNNIPDPQGTDSYNLYPGGYTVLRYMVCDSGMPPPATPIASFAGAYEAYKRLTIPGYDTISTVSGPLPKDTSAIGVGFIGELYHAMGIDHIGPLRGHFAHANGDDGCADTPWEASSNVLGCDFSGADGTKCALTQCQLGKIHYYFDKLHPAIQRFPTGAGPHEPIGTANFNMVGNCDITMPIISINSGETVNWNIDKQLSSEVVVKGGGKLYIRCRVGMPEGASITVEKNGRLFLYGEVYNNCDGKLWQGIVVDGSHDKPQAFPPIDHGYFVVNQGGTIEGAKTSIQAESGAMVIVQNAFIRNSGGALFDAYNKPNTSRFANTRFSCNGDTFNLAGEYSHASLSGTTGIRFSNCDFTITNAPTGLLSAGVEGDGSSFKVFGSRFTNLEVGIHAASSFSSAFKSIIVKDCSFSDNHDGIITFGMQNCAITNNNFNIRSATGTYDYPSGLMMKSCTGYTVEGNHFNNSVQGRGRYGTMTESSGADANLIQRNFYKDLDEGNFAKGVNRGQKYGLQYLCNTDEGNVPIGFFVEASGNGIHTSQGNGSATMNTFSHTGTDFENYQPPISYYYQQGDLAHLPTNYVGLLPPIGVTSSNQCSGSGGTNGIIKLTPTEWTGIENEFYAARTGWNTKKAALATLMDGGNTAGLLAQINDVTSQTAGQVKQDLLSISPYLSNEALAAVIGKMQVLTENGVVQVLNANPDGLREPETWNLVKASFSTTVANGILANAANQTARTTKDNEVGTYRATMQYKADVLLIDIANDSLQTDLSLMRTWLANKESLEADYAIVGSYVSEGDFTTADQKLATMPTAHALNAADMVEHGYFEDLVDIWEAIYTNGTPIDALDDATFAAIKNIADNSTRRAGAIAQGLLNNWYGHRYRVVPQSGGGQQLNIPSPPAANSTVAATNYVTAFPNPAKGSVTFQWKLPNGMESATITLSDLQGRTLETLKVNGQSGKQEWSTLGLSDGIYLYHIKLPDGTSSTSKLTIIK